MPTIEQLLYQTEKKWPSEVFYKNTVFKNFAIFIGKYQCEILRTPILKNICVWLLLNWLYEVIVWNFVSGSYLKPSRLSNITKILVTFITELLTKFGIYVVNAFL